MLETFLFQMMFLFLSLQHFSSFILYMILIPRIPESQITFNGQLRPLLTSLLFSAYLHVSFLSLFATNTDCTYVWKTFYLAMSISWLLLIHSDFYLIRHDCFELAGEKEEEWDDTGVLESIKEFTGSISPKRNMWCIILLKKLWKFHLIKLVDNLCLSC